MTDLPGPDPLADPRYAQPPRVNYDLPQPDTFEQSVEQARAAIKGEGEWSMYLTAPAVLASAFTLEIRALQERVTQLEDSRDDSDADG